MKHVYTFNWTERGICVEEAEWQIPEYSISHDRLPPHRYSTTPKTEWRVRIDIRLGYPIWRVNGIVTEWHYGETLRWERYTHKGLIAQPVSRIIAKLLHANCPNLSVVIPSRLSDEWV